MKIANRKIFLWCCKPLGICCLDYLLQLIAIKFPKVAITGVCVNDQDACSATISKLAENSGIPVFTQNNIDLPTSDLGIIIGFPHKIALAMQKRFRHGIINLHFAPLPYYRGSKTLSHAIINNEKQYGLTLHYIDEHLDTGPIIAVKWAPLDQNQTALEIMRHFEDLALEFFQEYIEKMILTILPATPQQTIIMQEHIQPHICTRSSFKKLYRISLDWPFQKIHTYVRALTLAKPEKPFVEKNGQRIFLSLSE